MRELPSSGIALDCRSWWRWVFVESNRHQLNSKDMTHNRKLRLAEGFWCASPTGDTVGELAYHGVAVACRGDAVRPAVAAGRGMSGTASPALVSSVVNPCSLAAFDSGA